MTTKYKMVRMPICAYNNFKLKHQKMKIILEKITKKEPKLSFAQALNNISEHSVEIRDEYLIKKSRRKK